VSSLDGALIALQAGLLLRFAAVIACALARRPTERFAGPLPPVSVVVPAFNEAAHLERTLRSIASSDVADLELIVVDDGSHDGTAEVARALQRELPTLVLISFAENRGKAAALNAGVARARGEVVVTVDADTEVAPTTVEILARAALGPGVGAAAANVAVGNALASWLTRWQALEYVTAHHLERRAQATWGCITTVPGAAAGWRRTALLEAGGFSGRTCTEDMDLTLSLHQRGYRVVFAADATAATLAPHTVSGLFRQRLRWLSGNLHAAALHWGSLFSLRRPVLGFIGLPNVWFTQLATYLLAPVSVVATMRAAHWLGLGALALYGSWWALDLAACRLAYWLDGGAERPRWLDLAGQRLLAPFFSWAVFAAVVARAAAGRPAGWSRSSHFLAGRRSGGTKNVAS
jgi:cellulose synthase/poly-beta-1,6-N-acetylglucosamine synthase-like glycosyltransferase